MVTLQPDNDYPSSKHMMLENKSYADLISQIESLVEAGRNKAVMAVNQVMVATY